MRSRVISLRGEAWTHKTSLAPSIFIEVSVPSHENQRYYIWVLLVSILPVSTLFILELVWQCGILLFVILSQCYWYLFCLYLRYLYWTCSDSVVFCCLSFYHSVTGIYFACIYAIYIGTGLTVWYSVVCHFITVLLLSILPVSTLFILELVWQCGILLFIILSQCYWYLFCLYQRYLYWNWSDSVVFCCLSFYHSVLFHGLIIIKHFLEQ